MKEYDRNSQLDEWYGIWPEYLYDSLCFCVFLLTKESMIYANSLKVKLKFWLKQTMYIYVSPLDSPYIYLISQKKLSHFFWWFHLHAQHWHESYVNWIHYREHLVRGIVQGNMRLPCRLRGFARDYCNLGSNIIFPLSLHLPILFGEL